MRWSACLALVFAALSCGCNTPTEPTSTTPRVGPSRPTTPARHTSATGFDDLFWRDLVYAAYGREGNGLSGPMPFGSNVLDHTRNFHIDTRSMPADVLAFIHDSIPTLWRDITGRPYDGRIEAGPGDNDEPGWTSGHMHGPDADFCGTTADVLKTERHHSMWIRIYSNPRCAGPRQVFVHEFGHALGFSHVREAGHVMQPQVGATWFTRKEQYHTQLAYRVGRGAEYCGEPFTPGCP